MELQRQSNLKTVLHEPVAPYFTNTYNTLISVVQGVSLGTLIYVIRSLEKQSEIDFFVVCKSIFAFFFICLVWHRYLVHIQYLAWRINILDTIIPMFFVFLQIQLILSINKSVFLFTFWISLFFGWAAVAYRYAVYRHNKPETLELYKEHFACIGEPKFAEDFWWVLEKFNKETFKGMFILSVSFGLLAYVVSLMTHHEKGWNWITIMALGFAFWCLFKYDLKHRLNKSEKLKRYGFKW